MTISILIDLKCIQTCRTYDITGIITKSIFLKLPLIPDKLVSSKSFYLCDWLVPQKSFIEKSILNSG